MKKSKPRKELRGNGYFVNEPNYELMAKAFTELYFSFTNGGSGDVEFDKLGTIALFSALANDEEGKQKELDKMRAHVKRLKKDKKEIDKVLSWSSSLPSACRVPIKREANKT